MSDWMDSDKGRWEENDNKYTWREVFESDTAVSIIEGTWTVLWILAIVAFCFLWAS